MPTEELRRVFAGEEGAPPTAAVPPGTLMRVVERADDGLRVTRMAVPLRDTEEENLLDHLEPCLHFIDEGRKVIASPGLQEACSWHCSRGSLPVGTNLLHLPWPSGSSWVQRLWLPPFGLRGVLLHIAIVQAALPQGIVPFVFAMEYNVHLDILSTAVILGMLIALPITLVYYTLLGL
ncbi:unnamed protein product [Urochloa humidicola]